MLNSKLIGGILLITGTSIGGGMLALPVSTAAVGFTNSIFFLIFCWAVMTAGALLILEVNLRLPAGSNMVSMAKHTLGLPGQMIAWLTYLVLLYTLLAAYIAGGSDMLKDLLSKVHVELPAFVASIVFTVLLGLIVYSGIRAVDYFNRVLMVGKFWIYLVLVIIISPHITLPTLRGGSLTAITSSLMILIASFGFASIVPTLRDYFKDETQTVRQVILYGSFIPLVCYIVWEAAIMGVIQREGSTGLLALMNSSHSTSGLMNALNNAIQSPFITGFFGFFTSICMVTAFLAVSLGLFDFIADGLQFKKTGAQGKCTLALTFLPPLLVVMISPGIYLHAFRYAGICCVVLLLLLPTIMAWKGRKLDTTENSNRQHLVPGGNISLAFLGIIAVFLLILSWQ